MQDFNDVWSTESNGAGSGSSDGQMHVMGGGSSESTTSESSGDHREQGGLTTTTTVEGDGPLRSFIDATPLTVEEFKIMLDLGNFALFLLVAYITLKED